MNARTPIALLLLMSCVTSAVAAEQTVMGAWKRHEVELTYMGFTTRYSCDGLRDKAVLMLRQLGVRPGFKVTSMGCPGFQQVTDFPRVRMVFEAPELPVKGQRGLGEPVPAVWQRVQFAERQPRDVERGDCELVEQFRDKVLPLLATRNLVDRTSCIPHQLSGSVINLQLEVLVGQAADKR
ncbi:MAG: hypothetical protein KA224_09390 [Steroidobacteraceae bacterium]|nr:hypothetical protein [Steroidobacteraceae bacterium]MCC7200837.1 hypothetical protein [Gammaproteobacteria bacterium]